MVAAREREAEFGGLEAGGVLCVSLSSAGACSWERGSGSLFVVSFAAPRKSRVVVEGEEKRELPGEENGGLKTVHLSRRA